VEVVFRLYSYPGVLIIAEQQQKKQIKENFSREI
jgi:hypothetical protein